MKERNVGAQPAALPFDLNVQESSERWSDPKGGGMVPRYKAGGESVEDN